MNSILRITLCLTIVCIAAGCADNQIAAGPSPLPADEDSALFLDRVSSQPNVSENDAMRGLLLLIEGEDSAGGFNDRVERLQARDILPSNWHFRADRPITRGKLAYMVYQAADVPGGVTLTLAGPSRRYCLRELQFRGFMGNGAVYAPVGGLEFISVLNRTDAWMQEGEIPAVISTNPGR